MFENPSHVQPTVSSNSSCGFLDVPTQTTRLEVSRPLTIYDPSIDPEDVYILQSAYSEASNPTHPQQNVFRLFQKFSLVYGPSILHPSLRHTVVTFCMRWLPYLNHGFFEMDGRVQSARRALRHRLSDVTKIDEGDMFASFLLALHGIEGCKYNEAKIHVQGFINLMIHLYNKARKQLNFYPLSIFWRMARDEIILKAFKTSMLDGMDISVHELSSVLGYTIIQERTRYQELLTGTRNDDPISVFITASYQQFSTLKNLLRTRKGPYWRIHTKYDSDFKLVLSNLQADFNRIDDDNIFESFTQILNKTWELGNIDGDESCRQARDIVTGLVLRHLSRLLFIYLEAESGFQWRNSPARKKTASDFFVLIHRVHSAVRGLDPDRFDAQREYLTLPDTYSSFEEMVEGNY